MSDTQPIAFEKVTLIGDCRLTEAAVQDVARLSRSPLSAYEEGPASDEESSRRVAGADCVLVSFKTHLTAPVLRGAASLRYIGMCCSLYDERAALVDVAEARRLGIEVRGVRDYGDEGTVEFVFAQLIALMKGLGPARWREEPAELTGKRLGVIGFGTVGRMVAQTALHFGMDVAYYSRRRSPDVESARLAYLPLHALLARCDVVTTHVPRHTILLGPDEFRRMKPNSVLVNTSLGPTFDTDAFLDWLVRDPTSFAILDADGAGAHASEFARHANVLVHGRSAGFSTEARQRLSAKVLANMVEYLGRA